MEKTVATGETKVGLLHIQSAQVGKKKNKNKNKNF